MPLLGTVCTIFCYTVCIILSIMRAMCIMLLETVYILCFYTVYCVLCAIYCIPDALSVTKFMVQAIQYAAIMISMPLLNNVCIYTVSGIPYAAYGAGHPICRNHDLHAASRTRRGLHAALLPAQ